MNTLRITALSLLLSMSVTMTAVWAAASVSDLITTGDTILKQTDTAKNARDEVAKQNENLVEEGKQLVAEQQQLPVDQAAWQKESDALKQRIADYHTKCENKMLGADEKKACKAELDSINSDISKNNDEQTALNKRIADFNDRGIKHNQSVKDLQTHASQSDADYNHALDRLTNWLDQALDRVNDQGFKPYAKKAGCPDVSKQPTTDDGVIKMSDKVLACLKRFSETG